jgi:hypothetical protein
MGWTSPREPYVAKTILISFAKLGDVVGCCNLIFFPPSPPCLPLFSYREAALHAPDDFRLLNIGYHKPISGPGHGDISQGHEYDIQHPVAEILRLVNQYRVKGPDPAASLKNLNTLFSTSVASP